MSPLLAAPLLAGPLLAGKVWTYWISWFLLVPGVLMVVYTVIGYLVKVQSQKYPRK